MQDQNVYLLIGAVLSFVASILHILIIIGGPGWYRFFGAGEKFASAAAAGAIVDQVAEPEGRVRGDAADFRKAYE